MRRGATCALAVAIAIAAVLTARPALACSCSALPVAALVEGAGTVFVGTVTDIERVAPSARNEGHADVIVEVESVYKAALPETVRVRTPASVASCGIPFLEGSQYLIFAEQDGRVLRSDLCFGTTADVALMAKNGYTSTPPGGDGAGSLAADVEDGSGGRAGTILLALALIGATGFFLRREVMARGGLESLLADLRR